MNQKDKNIQKALRSFSKFYKENAIKPLRKMTKAEIACYEYNKEKWCEVAHKSPTRSTKIKAMSSYGMR